MESGKSEALRIGLVGVGKIAQDQHVPALAKSNDFELVATASQDGKVQGIPAFSSIEEMIASVKLDAVSICTPPSARREITSAALSAGLHVMLEKPPATTLSEVAVMEAQAKQCERTLFASWHSREAAGVASAAKYCKNRSIRAVTIIWHEDIRQWHPGQEWIMGPGGFGVFDPGINALSILTAILPEPIIVHNALLSYPENRSAPIAVNAQMSSSDAPISTSFDFLTQGTQIWTIKVETDESVLLLEDGGSRLSIDGKPVPCSDQGEYPSLYRNFKKLIIEHRCDADIRPLRLVADMLLIGERKSVEGFNF